MKKELSPDEFAKLKENALGLLRNLRQTVILKYPFIGNVSMKLDLVPVRDIRCRTACTDGHTVFFDIAFLAGLNEKERLFVLGHEIWHNVMLHFARKQTRETELFNIAADLEVNQLLVKDGFTIPKNLCTPETLDVPSNLSAEEYYELLLKKAKNNKNSNSRSDKGDSENKLDGQFDKHVHIGESNDENTESNGITDKYGEVGFDPDFKPYVSKNAVDKMREAAVSAAQAFEKSRGEVPAHIANVIKTLTKSEIDWKEYLANFTTRCLGEKRSWCPPNRRHVWHDSYLQSRRGERIKIVVGLDTSSSTQGDMSKFLGELNALVQTFSRYDIHLIQCDAEVESYKLYDENDPLDLENVSFDVHGGGGTTLHPIFDYVKEHAIEADCYVIFTDGYVEDFPETDNPGKPVLWMITNDGDDRSIHFGEKVKFKNN